MLLKTSKIGECALCRLPLDELTRNEAGNIIRILIYNLGANNCQMSRVMMFKDIFKNLEPNFKLTSIFNIDSFMLFCVALKKYFKVIIVS